MSARPLPLAETRVLLVDEDPSGAKLMSVVLAAGGAHVRSVRNADAALGTAIAFDPHIVVVDRVLGGEGALALSAALRRDERTRGAAIVVVSGSNGHDDVAAAFAAGCAEYLRKPIDVDTFAETLAKHRRRP